MNIRFSVLLIIYVTEGDAMKIETIKTDAIKEEIIHKKTIKTGTILELKMPYAILLSGGMEFVYVKKKEGMAVGQTIYYFEEDIYRTKRFNYRNLLVYAASICFMLIVMYGATHVIQLGEQPLLSYGIITMDINPSVEIHIDEMGKVLRTVALNRDARSIIQGEYRGLLLEEVLDTLTQNARDGGYLEEDGAVMLTYTLVNQEEAVLSEVRYEDQEYQENEEDKNTKRIETYIEKQRDHYKFLFAKGTEEAIRASKSQGLSVGKYMLLNYMDETITLEALKEMSIEEIFEIIDETDFEDSLNNKFVNKHKEGIQGPPDHSNASDQGRFSASEEKKWLQDQNKEDKQLETEKEDEDDNKEVIDNNNNKDKEKPTPNINSNENSGKDKETTNNSDKNIENKNNSQKENKTDLKTDSDIDADIDADTDIDADEETEANIEKKTPSNNSTNNSNKEKTNNGINNQDNTTIEEVKETEPEKVKEKDTTKVNSGKSETKSNSGNSKK